MSFILHESILKLEPVGSERSQIVMDLIREKAYALESRATLAYRANGSETMFVHVRTALASVDPLVTEIIMAFPDMQIQVLPDEGKMIL